MRIIREKITRKELFESCEFIFNKNNYDEDYYTIKETIAIGKRDCERFVVILDYYLKHDYERFERIVRPMLEEMINDFSLKKIVG